MNEAFVHHGARLEVVVRRADDGTNDGSIVYFPYPGHAYCIAKAPRYASDEEWLHNATLIVELVRGAGVFLSEVGTNRQARVEG